MRALLVVLLAQAGDPHDKPKAEACVLELSLSQRYGAAETTIDATLTNVSGKRLTFKLASRCPAPSLLLAGLPEGVDPFGTCTVPCLSAPPVERTLAAGERLVVGTAKLYREKPECGAALEGGPFTVTATVPFMAPAPVVCAPKPIAVRGYPAAAQAPKCQPIACARPVCPPGQTAKSDDGCPTCSCR